jgi:hypothetical protein
MIREADMAVTSIDLEDVEKILGRALIDSAFRKKLVSNPEEVLNILGFGKPSDDAIAFFKALDTGGFPQAANDVENRLGGRAVVGLWI